MSHGFARISTDQEDGWSFDLAVMNTPPRSLKHSHLTEKILPNFCEVDNQLGHEFLASTYAAALVVALEESGLGVAREVAVPVWFRGRAVGQYYADLLVGRVVLFELKAAGTLESAHEAQLLNDLRATEVGVGLLLNFGVRPRFRRFLGDHEKKKLRGNPLESVAQASA
jgi:GxxExxY protein